MAALDPRLPTDPGTSDACSQVHGAKPAEKKKKKKKKKK